MSKLLYWPISKDMVGTKVVFKGYLAGHEHWGYEVGNHYVISIDASGDIGPMAPVGVCPPENYQNTFVFEVLPTKWYQRLINWFKGVLNVK